MSSVANRRGFRGSRRPPPPATNDHPPSTDDDKLCVVCFKDVDIYSIGVCDHPVCFECSTRMRVLCARNECPICRQKMPRVLFTRIVKQYRTAHLDSCSRDVQYDIYFEGEDVWRAYCQLLEHRCPKCSEHVAFETFQALQEHVRRQHELHYCDLCVDNLHIFSSERRCYDRATLARHRRKGDVDNSSHRGHPLCKFCDQRYVDEDDLFRHLRREHYYCHFCDADGRHEFYHSYDSLRVHYRQNHYLCEEGECLEEKFTSVFRTDIDLKAHRASAHSKHLGKAASKQARMLEFEFTLAPRRDEDERRGKRGPGGGPGGGPRGRYRERETEREVEIPVEEPTNIPLTPVLNTNSPNDFPTLGNTAVSHMGAYGGSTSSDTMARRLAGSNGLTVRATARGLNEEEFPALGASVKCNGNVSIQFSSSSAAPTTSVHVSRVPKKPVNAPPKPKPKPEEDFPALSSTTVPKKGRPLSTIFATSTKTSTAPQLRDGAPAYTSLVKNTKKATSVVIPVSSRASEPVENVKQKQQQPKKKKEKILSDEDFPQLQNMKIGPERKRTEIQIDNPNVGLDVPVPPPGFPRNPPPGFATSVTLNSVARPKSNVKTNVKSKVQSEYIQPSDFTVRNQGLVTKIHSMCSSADGETVFQCFRQLSTQFRSGKLPARDYFTQCSDVLGEQSFKSIFPELLALLPDISKQQELLAIYEDIMSSDVRHTVSVCSTCKQVLDSKDAEQHQRAHSLESNFPALANGASKSGRGRK